MSTCRRSAGAIDRARWPKPAEIGPRVRIAMLGPGFRRKRGRDSGGDAGGCCVGVPGGAGLSVGARDGGLRWWRGVVVTAAMAAPVPAAIVGRGDSSPAVSSSSGARPTAKSHRWWWIPAPRRDEAAAGGAVRAGSDLAPKSSATVAVRSDLTFRDCSQMVLRRPALSVALPSSRRRVGGPRCEWRVVLSN